MTLELQGYQSLADTPLTFFDKLGAHVLRSLSETTAPPIQGLERELTGVIRKVLAGADKELIAVLEGSTSNTLASNAYKLGKLSFAQQLVASASVSRVSEDFLSLLSERRMQPYLSRLLRGACTNIELAKVSGEAEETVSRKIKGLRAAGVTDFRREATYVYNFLTPTARKVLENLRKQNERAVEEEHDTGFSLADKLDEIRQRQPLYMQSTPTFGVHHVE